MNQGGNVIKKEFLGWDQPFITLLVEWLWQRKEELPSLLVVVPTDASAVRLRMALAQRGGCLSPQIETPDTWQKSLEKIGHTGVEQTQLVAPPELEAQLWLDLLSKPSEQRRWQHYTNEAFNLVQTQPGNQGRSKSSQAELLSKPQVKSLAKSIAELRRYLAKSALTLAQGAQSLEGSFEQRKWQLLAHWEKIITEQLQQIDLLGLAEAKQQYLAKNDYTQELNNQGQKKQIVLAGVSQLEDSQKAYYQAYVEADYSVRHLIAAPQSLNEKFDDWGLPITQSWLEYKFRLLDVAVAETAYEQSDSIVTTLSNWQDEADIDNTDVSLIVIKPGHVSLVEEAVSQAGWKTKSLAPKVLDKHVWSSCLSAWIEWLEQPTWAKFRALIDYSMIANYLGMSKVELINLYDKLRASLLLPEHKPITAINDWQLYGASQEHQDILAPLVNQLMGERRRCLSLANAKELIEWLEQEFLSLTHLQNVQGGAVIDDQEIKLLLKCWFDYSQAVEKWETKISFKAIDVLNMLSAKVNKQVQPVYDAQVELFVRGWAELMYESAPWLLMTDLNEGSLPENIGGEPWLYPEIKQALNLAGDEQREARDAYLLAYATESRHALQEQNKGGVKGFLIKKDQMGNLYEPCRFLMRVEPEHLAKRVMQLQIDDPDITEKIAGFSQDWQLDLTKLKKPKELVRMSASKLQDYIACPARFLLKHGYGMQSVYSENHELQSNDLGNIAHQIFDDFAKQEDLKDSIEAANIKRWMRQRLDQVFYAHFGNTLPLNLLLQKQFLLNRLLTWADKQVEHRKAGWQIKYSEYKLEAKYQSFTLVGKIDRIDYHSDKGWLIIDYKVQNKVKSKDDLKNTYLKKVKENTQIPEHLQSIESLQIEDIDDKGNDMTMQWDQIQLPLYAYLWEHSADYYACREPIQLAYACLPADAKDTGYSFWANYETQYSDAAWKLSCEIMNQINQGVFEPMNDAVKYDDLGLWNIKQGVTSFV